MCMGGGGGQGHRNTSLMHTLPGDLAIEDFKF